MGGRSAPAGAASASNARRRCRATSTSVGVRRSNEMGYGTRRGLEGCPGARSEMGSLVRRGARATGEEEPVKHNNNMILLHRMLSSPAFHSSSD